jgi:hypothetical protein
MNIVIANPSFSGNISFRDKFRRLLDNLKTFKHIKNYNGYDINKEKRNVFL